MDNSPLNLTKLTAVKLPVKSQMERVFPDDPRFFDGWWDSEQPFKQPDAMFGNRTSYSFTIDGDEVARALVCVDRSALRGYLVPVTARTVSEIQFIEVRPDLRSRGVATAVLALLCQLLPGVVVALALPEAVEFWRRTGWLEVPPDDGDEYRSIAFIAPPENRVSTMCKPMPN